MCTRHHFFFACSPLHAACSPLHAAIVYIPVLVPLGHSPIKPCSHHLFYKLPCLSKGQKGSGLCLAKQNFFLSGFIQHLAKEANGAGKERAAEQEATSNASPHSPCPSREHTSLACTEPNHQKCQNRRCPETHPTCS